MDKCESRRQRLRQLIDHAAALAEQAAQLIAEVSGGDTAGTRVTVGRRAPPARPSKITGQP